MQICKTLYVFCVGGKPVRLGVVDGMGTTLVFRSQMEKTLSYADGRSKAVLEEVGPVVETTRPKERRLLMLVNQLKNHKCEEQLDNAQHCPSSCQARPAPQVSGLPTNQQASLALRDTPAHYIISILAKTFTKPSNRCLIYHPTETSQWKFRGQERRAGPSTTRDDRVTRRAYPVSGDSNVGGERSRQ
jgi:hypothetical protein